MPDQPSLNREQDGMQDAALTNAETQLPAAKKQWVSPQLIEYGSVAKLTQSGGSTRAEGTVARMRMACL